MTQDLTDRVRIRDVKILSDKRYQLREVAFDYRRRDGKWQSQDREVFDRRHAAAVLPIDPARGTVLLVSQFRLPAFQAGYEQPLVEVIAGALDGDAPEVCARREAMEEAGCVAERSPPSLPLLHVAGRGDRAHASLRRALFHREPDRQGWRPRGRRREDIEVLELPLARALAMVETGEIADAKTILLLQWAKMPQLEIIPSPSRMWGRGLG